MDVFEPIEVSERVRVPGVRPMDRVELRSPDGEVLEVHYRWASSPELSDDESGDPDETETEAVLVREATSV